MSEQNDFFGKEVRLAVERYEKMLQNKEHLFIDEETFEDIIDYYLQTNKPTLASRSS